MSRVVGGAFSNIMALNLSRFKCCPDVKMNGVYGLKRLKIYVSAEVRNHQGFSDGIKAKCSGEFLALCWYVVKTMFTYSRYMYYFQ